MSRSLLHKDKLNAFKEWLTQQGIEHRPGRGDYQVLQVRSRVGKQWHVVYERNEMPQHLTTARQLDGLVTRFCRENRAQYESKGGV